ncbi:MAG: MFS transporter [Myxococcota bacterium]|nr:MFS transporter [Myxococcota bacterium]
MKTSTTSGPGPVSLSTKLYYGFGSVAYGVKDNGFSFMLLIYYNQVLGLPASWVGTALMLALIADAFSDPLVGYFSDNLHSRWGRRHPFMYVAALPTAVCYFMLWNPPSGLSPSQLLGYFLGVAIAVRTFLTLYEIPSTSLVAELTDDYDTRTSMLGFRYFFGWWGGLGMSVFAYFFLLPQDLGGVLYGPGYRTYGAVASAIIFAAILISAIGTHRHIPSLKAPPTRQPFAFGRTLAELRETLANRSFFVLFISALFSAMAAGVSTSLNIYFNNFFWELTTLQMGSLSLPFFLSAGVALAIAPRLSIGLGKKKAALAIAGLAFICSPIPVLLRLLDLFPANGTDALFYTLLCFGTLEVTLIITASILISSMVADVVEESELKTGRRSEGVFFAARSFAQKSVHGIGTFTATAILTAIDFPTDAQPGAVPAETLRELGFIYVPVLMVLYVLAFGFLTGYRISRESHEEHLTRLQAED